MLATVLVIMLYGFMVGAFARLAVPGPDPMPAWLTISIGLVGSAAGWSIADAAFGGSDFIRSLGSLVAAVALVVTYRKVVQKRPAAGPEAFRFPERGVGIERFRERLERAQRILRDRQREARQAHVDEQLKKLNELHDAGVLTDEEFEQKRQQLLSEQ